MMRVTCGMFAALLCATAASAQGPAQQGPVSRSLSLQRSYAAIKDDLILAADKLPEADYAFKPSSMPEVRYVRPALRPRGQRAVQRVLSREGRAEP